MTERYRATPEQLDEIERLVDEAKAERVDLLDTIDGLRADIESLCEALWKREPGCEFVCLNYPAIAARLEAND